MIRVSKIFTFEMAHALLNYEGSCRHIHGHSYRLHVTVIGEPRDAPGHPEDGMVIDFRELKAIVREHILAPFDHALALNQRTPPALLESLKATHQKVVLLPFQPTCERLVQHFAELLQEALPPNVRLHALRLYETATAYAEWEAGEQTAPSSYCAGE